MAVQGHMLHAAFTKHGLCVRLPICDRRVGSHLYQLKDGHMASADCGGMGQCMWSMARG